MASQVQCRPHATARGEYARRCARVCLAPVALSASVAVVMSVPNPVATRPFSYITGRRPGDRERVCLCMHAVLVLVQLVLVVGAFMLPAFERVVEGSMAKLLLDAGVDFTSYISMWSLPAMVARDGGLDYLMAATFTLFIVIAPCSVA